MNNSVLKHGTLKRDDVEHRLRERLGAVHASQRLGIEGDHHKQVLSWHGHFFHLENWYSIHGLIRACVKFSGMQGRGLRNACDIQLRQHRLLLPTLPEPFEGLRILHLSDLHVDMYPQASHALIELLRTVDYDICVMTGDYRARTFGGIDSALAGLQSLRLHLPDPVYAVLGNHDSIRMVPAMEDMGIKLLLNEAQGIERDGAFIDLAGIDDAHYFRVDNIEKAAAACDPGRLKILLSHTPEVFRQGAHAGFDVFLCGHTHGGQICLPGGTPLTLDASCPRHLGKGPWRYQQMQGYTSAGAGTSIVNFRFNCPPEITLHTLTRG